MARVLVIDPAGRVVNVAIVPDTGTTWTPPTGMRTEPAVSGVGIGWRWDGTGWESPWSAPEQSEEPE